MRYFVLLFILSSAAWAQCSSLLVPQALTFTVPSYGPRGVSQTVAVNPGPGNPYSITGFGSIAIIRNTAGGSSGTGNDTVYVYINGQSDQRAPGSQADDTITLSINGTSCPLTIHWSVVARKTTTWTNNAGVPDTSLTGSSSSGGWVSNSSAAGGLAVNDLINPSAVGSIPGGVNLRPALGSFITEPVYGTKIYNCTPSGTPSGSVTVYASISAMNSDDTALYVDGPGGTPSFIKFPCDGVLHQPTLTPSSQQIMWYRDGSDNTVGFWTSDSSGRWEKVVFSSLTSFTVASQTNPYTFACSGGSCATLQASSGGTDDITDDNWTSFFTNMDHNGNTAHPQACLLDLNTNTEHCIDVSINYNVAVPAGMNFSLASKGFSPFTHKRYLITNCSNGGICQHGPLYSYSVGAGSGLVFEHYMGIFPEMESFPINPAANYTSMACTGAVLTADLCLYTGAHSGMAQDTQGHQLWCYNAGNQEPSLAALGCIDLDAPEASASLASQLGGNFNNVLAAHYGGGGVDMGVGSAGDWITATVGNGFSPGVDEVISYAVVSPGCVTSGGNINCTVSPTPGSGLVIGNQTNISGVGGCTNANGLWAGSSITVASAVITISGVTCNASWTSGGYAYKNAYLPAASFRHEIVAMHLSNGYPIETHRLGTNFGLGGSADSANDGYYVAGQGNLSPSKKYVVVNSNWGNPGDNHVTVLATGIILSGLQITKTHVGNFTQGQSNAPYTLTVSNTGASPTDGTTVTVADTVPAGESLVSMSGVGWTCVSNSCTRSDILNGSSAYPTITVLVNVASNASSPQLELASVSGGGFSSANTSDSTIIIATAGPILGIVKSHLGNFTQGQQNAVSSIVISNSGGAPTDGSTVTVTETVPAGETLASLSGTGWTCVSNSCTRSDALAASQSYPAITVSVNIAPGATSPQLNQCSVSGGGSASANGSDSQMIIPLNGFPGSLLRVSRQILH